MPCAAQPASRKDSQPFARRIWKTTRLLAGTVAERYLDARGVGHVAGAPALRFHPGLSHPSAPGRFLCLVAGVQDAGERFLGIQRTYLSVDGSGKADVDPVRASLGSLAGGAVRLAESIGDRLLVGEGIETTAAAALVLDWRGGAWATLGTSGLRAVELPELVREVTIAADRDVGGLRAAAALARRLEGEGRRVEIRAKLPGDCTKLIDAAQTDPGAPFEPAAVAMLSKLRTEDPASWQRARAMLKAIDGVTIGDVDRATAPAGEGGDGKQGRPVEWDDPEPWPEPVDGAALLGEIKAKVECYADLPGGGADAVTLWALYTWTFESFSVSPNLMVTAPERESGKTRVTELLSWMVRRAKPVSDASAAAIIRGIERDRPTLLFDEAQSFLKRKADDPIRGVLLASFSRRFAYVERVEGESHDVRAFSTFTPKAMNGRNLARVDDMLTSRSIVLSMTRATRRLPELRDDRDPVGLDMRRRCARWAADNAAALREADPDVGERMGRSAQVWRPLFAIADAAGGDWPAMARTAADALSASAAAVADGETLGTMLLADVREVFRDLGDPERIQSKDLDKALIALPERPWATLRSGDKPMSATKRGLMLKDYGIQPKNSRVNGSVVKVYERVAFEEAWSGYLSELPGSEPATSLQPCKTSDFVNPQPATDAGDVAGSISPKSLEKQGL